MINNAYINFKDFWDTITDGILVLFIIVFAIMFIPLSPIIALLYGLGKLVRKFNPDGL